MAHANDNYLNNPTNYYIMPRDIFGNIIRTNPWTGKKISKKQIKREVITENRRKGKAAEEAYKMRAQLAGYEVENTGRGHDVKLSKRNIFTGKKQFVGYREIKSSSTAPVSKLQDKTRRKMRGKYKVVRENPGFW